MPNFGATMKMLRNPIGSAYGQGTVRCAISRHCEGGSRPSSSFGKEHSRPRQSDPELGELARLGIDLNRPAMLFDDDVDD